MKTFRVILRGRDEEFIDAERYRREGDKYVFESDTDEEVRFFSAEDVVGIDIIPNEEPEPPCRNYY